MGGGGGGAKGPSKQEIQLGQIGSQKYQAGKNLVAGADYLTKMAKVDKSARYKEQSNAQVVNGLNKAGTGAVNNVLVPVGADSYSAAGGAAIAQSQGERNGMMDAVGKSALGVSATASSVNAQQAYAEQRKAEEEAKSARINDSILPSIAGVGIGVYAGSNEVRDSVNGFVNENVLKPIGKSGVITVNSDDLLSTNNTKRFGRYN